ncbi:aspartate--tRNA ligase [Salibacter halophilus]|uniref:Aspartate--tRNA ligase n=1 Tax=Salibacter halophilus TaxID=1803916 RepID=A0A6N6M5Z4_9FLAO|nr:aspartate--tRNA ligase [Salibacter halophilus]KAB1063720.1 aspartate--tRNA ligase [Salibacter halophilus]
MYRSHTCGELRSEHIDQTVKLAGWVQRTRNLGGMTFIDLRDRYGVTQLAFSMEQNADLCEKARKMGREFVIQIEGKVIERSSKNDNIPTGAVEISVSSLNVLSKSEVPPFTIEDDTDGGEELRMKYRYLDLRRNPLKNNMMLRHKLAIETRKYLDDQGFLEIETPYLIKSTPEGARDFVVPSRMHEGQFYALPQSPQTFKQLLMVSGYDKYFQIVRCFRDEDLRADRQPEFTQIDCEMTFVDREDVLNTFEGLTKSLFQNTIDVKLPDFKRMTYDDAMRLYGSDKPDLRFGMEFIELNELTQNKGFKVFDSAELVVGICAKGCANYSRKDLDKLTDFVKRPQIGAKGMVWVKYNEDGSVKSAVDKFYSEDDLKKMLEKADAQPGDLLLILSGETNHTRKAMNELRLEMGNRLGLRDPKKFVPLWVVDFPLLEWDEETERYHAMHHPFTSPIEEDMEMITSAPEKVRANAYDMVINGVEIGGGSIRIHDNELQQKMFDALGFTKEEAQKQFGFLLDAFKYGAPPHGGIAFGFDRLAALAGGRDNIREFIAFPKNNAGRDLMIDSPSIVSTDQLEELHLKIEEKKEE